jgi:hypothetical protein
VGQSIVSWKSAQRAARFMLDRMHLPPELRAAHIRLSQFPDQATKDFLRPGDSAWSNEFHQMVNRAIARELRKRGALVSFVTIELDEFFNWLVAAHKENTPATRAEFIALKSNEPPV